MCEYCFHNYVNELDASEALRANEDDLAAHGACDRQDVYDTTGNILVNYTLFGFENAIE
jgi:hypothetical protein